MKMKYSIAGLQVEMVGKQTLELISKLPGFDMFKTSNQNENNIDIHIYMDEDVKTDYLTDVRSIHSFRVLDIEHVFSQSKEGYLFEMCKQDGRKIVSIIYNTQGNKVFMSSCNCIMSAKYAIWVAYMLSAVEKKIVPIHASSIVKDSKAVLFLGESGTGKSTHTGLWMEYIKDSYLLNDDSPLLYVKDDMVFVYGSPWSGKTHCYRQEGVPVKAIVRLRQYPENIISHHDKLGSIGAIHPSLPPFLAYDGSFSEKLLSMIDLIIRHIPIYELKCLPDKNAAEIAYSTIY